jgi:hypothetical protein
MAPLARAAVAALAFLLLAAPARAAACDDQPLAQTFLPWADVAQYTPAPDGGFEAGGWSLSGGAAVVDANDPYLKGARALALQAGGAATSAPMCIGVEHPTLRFFARNAGSPLSALTVSVVVNGAALPIARVYSGQSWQPTAPLLLGVNLLGVDSVAFRFDAGGDGWSVDDVYVDPYRKG